GEQRGVFPSKVTDPATGMPFPNNTIPMSRWDPVAAGLLALYPLPNLPGTVNNFSYNPKERVASDEYNLRVDHHFGANDSIFGRISQSWGENFLPTLLPQPANQQGFTDLAARQIMLSETHTVSANKVNEFRLGFVYTLSNQDVLGPRLFDQYGIKGAFDTPKIKGLPTFTLTGFSQLGTPTALGAAPIAATGSGNFPAEKSGKIWQLLDNFSWVHDRHTLKFGVDLSRVTMFVYATNTARPTYTFNGTYTGSGVGDFLLGDVYTAATSQQQIDTIQQYIYSGYAQDDWKATNKLTVNFGLRYELPMPFIEAHDRQSNFVLDSGACYLQVVTVAGAGPCGVGRALVHPDYNNFAPRLGMAYQATGKTVVRSGFGVFYGRDEDLGISRRLPNDPPFITSATFPGNSTTPAFQLQNGFPANALSLASGSATVNSYPFNFPIPYVIQWNLNVERQLPGSFVAQVGYTGSEAHKLPVLVNVNQAVPGAGSVNSRRPYQGFGDIEFYGPLDNSNYHALIAKLERRFSKGLSLLASYTYGHSIDGGGNQNDSSDPGPQNVRDLAAQRGSSNFDVRHRFVVSGFYQLPFGKSGGIASLLTRNWQISGIFSAQTGQPFTATLSTDPTATGTTARPNRIADGNLSASERGIKHWFDTAAFVSPGCVCFGNSGRDILRAPGSIDVDLGVSRDFVFAERFRVQFRAESFNLMNHPNFSLPNSSIGNPQVGIISTVSNPERQNQLALKLYF
ncbi:MAG: TonB-dependent receptor, partial [Bryobacteraceae bacterium]